MSTQAQRAKAQPSVYPPLPAYPREVIGKEPEAEAKAKSQVGSSNNGLYPLCQPGAANPAPGAHMRIERSLSPDGRINSVSVMIDYPLGNESAGEIKAKAQKALLLQAEIIREHFAACEPLTASVPAVDTSGTPGSRGVAATLLDIGAISSRRGTRYFINAEVGGEQAKLYGSRRQLITHLARVGLDLTPDAIAEGLRLNLACRAVTKPGQQGGHLNVVRIYPAG